MPGCLAAMHKPMLGHLDPAFHDILREVVALQRQAYRAYGGLVLPLRQAVFWAVAVTILTVLAARSLEGSVMFGWSQFQLQGSWLLQLLPLAMVWPAAYIVASASWRRWRGRDGLGLGVASGA